MNNKKTTQETTIAMIVGVGSVLASLTYEGPTAKKLTHGD